jgi:hypothetical protein
MKKGSYYRGDSFPMYWPWWMKKAHVLTCEWEVTETGTFHWLNGIWLGEDWMEGKWHDGSWRGKASFWGYVEVVKLLKISDKLKFLAIGSC